MFQKPLSDYEARRPVSMGLLCLYQNAKQLRLFSLCFYFFFTCIDTVAKNANLLEKKIFHDICCLFQIVTNNRKRQVQFIAPCCSVLSHF